MNWDVKPKTQIFEGLGWYFVFPRPLGVESSGTINEHGNSVVMPVNKALTNFPEGQSLVVRSFPQTTARCATTKS